MEKFRELLQKDLDDPNGYWNTLAKQKAHRESRFPKVAAYIKSHSFPELIQRLQAEHDDTWKDKCYAQGSEPYPNNKFILLWSFITSTYESIHNDLIPQDFLNESYFIQGYWFTDYCGQGCFYRVYDKELNILFQI
jgi:hypothetical protein